MNALHRSSMSLALADKLHPRRFAAMSGKMAAIVAYLLGEVWTEPHILELSITSDGILSAFTSHYRHDWLGTVSSLWDNLVRLMDAAGLNEQERAELVRLARRRIRDFRSVSLEQAVQMVATGVVPL